MAKAKKGGKSKPLKAEKEDLAESQASTEESVDCEPSPQSSSPGGSFPDWLEEEPAVETDPEPNAFGRLFIFTTLGLCVLMATAVRLVSVTQYESFIHEYDPWYNYRCAEYLVNHDPWEFYNWESADRWYPMSKDTGQGIFYGMQYTAYFSYHLLHKVLMMPVHIREVCVLLPAVFGGLGMVASYLFALETTGKRGAALIATMIMVAIRAFLVRSNAGLFDNECVAITGMIFALYYISKTINTGSMLDGLKAALWYFYMAICWGGYVLLQASVCAFVLGVMILGRMNFKVYTMFTLIYTIGGIFMATCPTIHIAFFWQSTEHLPFHLTFLICQGYFVKKMIEKYSSPATYLAFRNLVFKVSFLGLVMGLFSMAAMGKGGTVGARAAHLLNPFSKKRYNPLVQSISEHKMPSWGSIYNKLSYTVFFVPLGVYLLFRKPSNARIFLICVALVMYYFSSIMVRLLIVAGPSIVCLAAVGLSEMLKTSSESIKDTFKTVWEFKNRIGFGKQDSQEKDDKEGGENKVEPKKKRKTIPIEAALIFLVCSSSIICLMHFKSVRANVSQNVGFVTMTRYTNGKRNIHDSSREVYAWIRQNTPIDAVFMSWWDYGYQLQGMGNRTTLTDNNTLNQTHIGLTGLIFGSTEEEAYRLCKEIGIDYLFIVFDGANGYSDDISKSFWFYRIAHHGFPYFPYERFQNYGVYHVGDHATIEAHASLIFKLSYYRFSQLHWNGKRGYDKKRNLHAPVSSTNSSSNTSS